MEFTHVTHTRNNIIRDTQFISTSIRLTGCDKYQNHGTRSPKVNNLKIRVFIELMITCCNNITAKSFAL